MTSAYFASLVILPTIITTPGRYLTRAGEVATITETSDRHNFGNRGTYADGTPECWHKSGRIFASRECPNDIVSKVIATMYATKGAGGLFELRQTRYAEQFKAGREHPHDVCAVARTVAELRDMCAKHWPDADYSQVEKE